MPPLDARGKVRLAALAVRAGALRPVPRAPAAELRPRGRRHSRERDRRAVSAPLQRLERVLPADPRRVDDLLVRDLLRGARTLEEAQRAKLELVCTKLGLRSGERVLDVGCGWGSFALHAAGEHGVRVTGITLSEPQAALARERAAAAGLADRIEIRVADYRDLAGEQFDAIASIGMVEHVGSANIDAYARQLGAVLRPGGRLLNHGIARLRHGDPEAGPFSERFVFPDAAPLHVSRVLAAIESGGPGADARRGLPARLRTHAARVGPQPRRARRARRIARRPGADESLAAVPARRATRVRQRLHVNLPDRGPPPAVKPPHPRLRATVVNGGGSSEPPLPYSSRPHQFRGDRLNRTTAKMGERRPRLEYRLRQNRPRRTGEHPGDGTQGAFGSGLMWLLRRSTAVGAEQQRRAGPTTRRQCRCSGLGVAQLGSEPWRCTVAASLLLIDEIDCPRVRRSLT